MSEGVYFRQLLSGRDFAVGDPVATQMVNFSYLIGDAARREAVLVDPAYAPADLLGVLAADDVTLTLYANVRSTGITTQVWSRTWDPLDDSGCGPPAGFVNLNANSNLTACGAGPLTAICKALQN